MGLLDKILGRAPATVVEESPDGTRSLIVTPTGGPSLQERQVLGTFLARRGMWLVANDAQVGILTGVTADGIGELTLTKMDGSTVMALDEKDQVVPARVYKPLSELRQAYIDEIPAPRRPDGDTLAKLGYTNRPGA